jgi:hypothetical protein
MQFEPVNPLAAGFVMDGDVRSLVLLPANTGKSLILGGVYAGKLRVFRLERERPEL